MVKQGSWNEIGTSFQHDKTKIFVFGSNLAGRHGMGAALYAKKFYGAVYGVGEGRTGNSYAIPTKGKNLEVLSLSEIKESALTFIQYAKNNPSLIFELTRVGCGLAGYKDEQIAPLFDGVPSNVVIPKEWKNYILQQVRK